MIKNYMHISKAIIYTCKNWPIIILSKILSLKCYSINLRNGTKLYIGGIIEKADLSMFSEIWYDKLYTPLNFKINDGDIVFDVGANNGYFSIYASQKTPSGKIFTFEPIPEMINKINRSIEINNIKNIKVEQMAIGHKNEIRMFNISENHNGCHSFYERNGNHKSINVKVTTLETYCKINNITYIDFLKLDCEGAEYEILTTESINFIKNHVNILSMEYHDTINEHHHSEIYNILIKFGFYIEINNGFIYAKINKNHNKHEK